MKAGCLRIERNAPLRICHGNGIPVFPKPVCVSLLLQQDRKVGIALHGGIHRTPQRSAVNGILQPNLHPDHVCFLPTRLIQTT